MSVTGPDERLDLHPEAKLGLATTRQLLLELEARGVVGQSVQEEGAAELIAHSRKLLVTLPTKTLNYRTVDNNY